MWRNAFYPASCITLVFIFIQREANLSAVLLLLGVVWANVGVHELGHVIAARWTGGRVLKVRVMPWHGKTTLQQAGPLAGAYVALAGPAAGFLVAAAAHRLVGYGGVGSYGSAGMLSGIALMQVLAANMVDNLLNMMPIWVLDGRACARHLGDWRRERKVRAAHDPAPFLESARELEESMRILEARMQDSHPTIEDDMQPSVEGCARAKARERASAPTATPASRPRGHGRETDARAKKEEGSSILIGSI